MKKTNNTDTDKMEEKVMAVGLNLSLLASLVNFLEYGITDTINFTNADISNLIVVMRRIISATRDEYEEIEDQFDL